MEKENIINEESVERVDALVNRMLHRVPEEEFIKATKKFDLEEQSQIFLTLLGDPLGREYVINEKNSEKSSLSEYVKTSAAYWEEESAWEDLSAIGLEFNIPQLGSLLEKDNLEKFYAEDPRAAIFIRNILRGVNKFSEYSKKKETILNMISRKLDDKVIDLLHSIEYLDNPEGKDMEIVRDMSELIKERHREAIIKYIARGDIDLISSQILSDVSFWKEFNIEPPSKLTEDQYNTLNGNLAAIYSQLEPNELDAAVILQKLISLKGFETSKNNVFDFMTHPSMTAKDRRETLLKFVAYGLDYEEKFRNFLLKKTENISDYLPLGVAFWLSSDGVKVLRNCILEDAKMTNSMLDKLSEGLDKDAYSDANMLFSLKTILNIGKVRIESGKDTSSLPKDSFLYRLNTYMDLYLNGSGEFDINNPPEDVKEIKNWLLMAQDLRDKTDLLQIVLNKFHRNNDLYNPYRDMITFSSSFENLEKEEKSIILWLKGLNPEIPFQEEIIEKLWKSIKKNIEFVGDIDLDSMSKRDLLVLSTLVIVESIEETGKFNVLSKLLERGIPMYQRIVDPSTYKLKKSFSEFVKDFKNFGFSGTEEEIALFYSTTKALFRLDERGLASEVFIDSRGIRVQDPYGSLVFKKQMGEKIMKTADPTEEKFLTWEQLRDCTYEVDYTYGAEIWTDIQATFRLLTFGAARSKKAIEKGRQTPSQKVRKKAYGEIRFIIPGTNDPALIIPPVQNPEEFARIVKEVAISLTKSDNPVAFDQVMQLLHKESLEEKKSSKK